MELPTHAEGLSAGHDKHLCAAKRDLKVRPICCKGTAIGIQIKGIASTNSRSGTGRFLMIFVYGSLNCFFSCLLDGAASVRVVICEQQKNAWLDLYLEDVFALITVRGTCGQ